MPRESGTAVAAAPGVAASRHLSIRRPHAGACGSHLPTRSPGSAPAGRPDAGSSDDRRRSFPSHSENSLRVVGPCAAYRSTQAFIKCECHRLAPIDAFARSPDVWGSPGVAVVARGGRRWGASAGSPTSRPTGCAKSHSRCQSRGRREPAEGRAKTPRPRSGTENQRAQGRRRGRASCLLGASAPPLLLARPRTESYAKG